MAQLQKSTVPKIKTLKLVTWSIKLAKKSDFEHSDWMINGIDAKMALLSAYQVTLGFRQWRFATAVMFFPFSSAVAVVLLQKSWWQFSCFLLLLLLFSSLRKVRQMIRLLCYIFFYYNLGSISTNRHADRVNCAVFVRLFLDELNLLLSTQARPKTPHYNKKHEALLFLSS